MPATEALGLDELTQDAIVRNLTVIGELAMRNHKEAPLFVTEHPEAAMESEAGHP